MSKKQQKLGYPVHAQKMQVLDGAALDGLEFQTFVPLAPAAPAAPEENSFLRGAADTAIAAARGPVLGVKMLADAAGADNPVSQSLGGALDYLGSLESDAKKARRAARAQTIQDAEASGSTLREVIANLGVIRDDPLDTLVEAAGTALPTVATALIPGAGPAAMIARTGAGLALGATQGAGAVKGSIYDETKRAQLAAGRSPQEAEQIATEAQGYSGQNINQIALGAGLGAVAARTGLESAAERLTHGVRGTVPGAAARVAGGAVAEGIPEAVQGGQERYATNLALGNQGFDVDPMRGVAGAAALEGATGGMLGGALGIPRPAQAQQPAGALTRAVQGASPMAETPPAGPMPLLTHNPEPLVVFRDGTAARPGEVEAYINSLPKEEQPQARAAFLNLAPQSAAPVAEAPEGEVPAPSMADGAPAASPSAAPQGEFASELEALAYIRQQRINSGIRLPSALPLEQEDGSWAVAVKGTPGFALALQQRVRRGEAQPHGGTTVAAEPAQPMDPTATSAPTEPPATQAARAPDFKTRLAALQQQFADPEARQRLAESNPALLESMAAAERADLPRSRREQALSDAERVVYRTGVKQTPELERAPRRKSDGQVLDPVALYVNERRNDGTPAGRSFGQEFDAGRITREEVLAQLVRRPQTETEAAQERLERAAAQAPRLQTPDQRLEAAAAQAREPSGLVTETGLPLQGDVLNRLGQPFTIKRAAIDQAKRTPGDVVNVAGGWVVRPQPAALASSIEAQPAGTRGTTAADVMKPPATPSIAGQPLDAEWTAFAPESGTKGVPRVRMPQIKAEHRGAMTNFLNARGIAHEQVDVPAAELKPTQLEFSPAKVEKAKTFEGGDRSILISADGHVLDGHHQWLARRDAGETVKAIRLDAPIDRLLAEVKEFPSAGQADGATQATAQPLSSEEWRNEGKTPEQIAIEPVARNLAGVIWEESGASDFAPSELPAAVRMWADDHGVPEQALRRATLDEIERSDMSDGRKAQIRRALQLGRDEAATSKALPPLIARAASAPGPGADEAVQPAQQPAAAQQPATVAELAAMPLAQVFSAGDTFKLRGDQVRVTAVKAAAVLAEGQDGAKHTIARGSAPFRVLLEQVAQRRGAAQPADAVGGPPHPNAFTRARAERQAAAAAPAASSQDPATRWDAMQPREREAVAERAGWAASKGGANIVGKRLSTVAWADLIPEVRKRMAQAMPAPAPAPQEAPPNDAPAFSRGGEPEQRLDTERHAAQVLQGAPVADLPARQAPHGYPALRAWATQVFADAGGRATNPMLGEILLDERAVRDSMAHGMNPFKAEAFAAVPEVLSKGVVVAAGTARGLQSYYVSAPVRIDGTDDIATVLVHRDATTQRMYLHSVITKEGLLRARDSSAGRPGGAAARSGKVTAGEVASVLRRLLSLNPGEASDEPLQMSRGGAKSGMPVLQVQAQADRLTAGWAGAPEVVAVGSISDPEVPEVVRRIDAGARSRGAGGVADGVFHGGKVYLFANALRSAADVRRVVFHEVLGHAGLRGVFGDTLDQQLRLIVAGRGHLVKEKLAQYGMENTPANRLQAAEEVLADLAQEQPELGLVRRAIAGIRTWLRERVPGLRRLALSDAEIIRDFIEPARAFVQRGGSAGAAGGGRAFADTEPMVYGREGVDVPLFSRGVVDALRSADGARAVRQALGDLIRRPGVFSFWHRSVGTQYHKAHKNSAFRRVYEAAQDFLHDTSFFANTAADQAPDLLPRLENLADVAKRLKLSRADSDAVAKAVFGGTLENQLYNPAQLREQFGFNDRQVELYRQFRAAVDVSLDQLAGAEAARLLGDDAPRGARRLLMAGRYADFQQKVSQHVANKHAAAQQEAADARERHAKELADLSRRWAAQGEARPPARREQEEAELKAAQTKELRPMEAAASKWADLEQQVSDKLDRLDQLKQQGYAPLMRFGRYSVHVTDADGKTLYFGLYESRLDANRAQRALQDGFKGVPGAQAITGVMSLEAYKLMRGVSPETLAVFGDASGLGKDEAFQQYLKLATANHSALRRLIHRKGISGFSEEPTRVLAAFLTSNARRAAGLLHHGEMDKAVLAAQQSKQGDVADEAFKLRDYVQNPTEEAPGIKNLLFVNYIGGSVASALVNLTQPFTMTLPYLSQFGGPAKTTGRLVAAAKDALGAISDPELRAALKRAESEGIVAPQEMHELQAEAQRALTNIPVARKALFVWGSLFQLAEAMNRRVSFIAAWRTAVANSMDDPFAFAVKAVDETQGVYNKANRPNWARGALGGTLFTFKQFGIAYLEFFLRLPAREKALALSVLLLAAGLQGMPFADDLDDLVDTIGQRAGYNTNAKLWKLQVLEEALGKPVAGLLLRGVTGLPGAPIDIAGRMSLGNLLPGTGLLRLDRKDKASDVAEVLGAVGGVGKQAAALANGEFKDALPVGLQNLVKGADMASTGAYRNARGYKVMDVDAADAVAKAVGFQPGAVAERQRRDSAVQQAISMAAVKREEIASLWASGIFEGDRSKVQAAVAELRDWNEKNPDSRISVQLPQVLKRVRNMRTERADRMGKAAPKAMRAAVQEALAD